MSQAAALHPGDTLAESVPELKNFSLVLGGPLYQFFRRTHLDDDAQSHLKHRLVLITGLIWLPLLAFCAIDGTLVRGVQIPFLFDIETHARFLVTVPLMIIAELVVHQRMREIVSQFVGRNLIPPVSRQRFSETLRSAMAWRNSAAVEIALLAFAITVGYYVRHDLLALKASTWYARVGVEGTKLTLSGIWFSWVSNPVMQFLMLRWLYRMFIWARFLWQVSRLDLSLIPTHPDRNAGVGFLSISAYAYSPLLAAFGAAVAGLIASRIFHEGAVLADFKIELGVLAAISVVLVLGPISVFAPKIIATKRRALEEYGALASEYSQDFERRWLRNGDHDGHPLLGSPDIQSLSDLANAYEIVRSIRPVPFNRDMLVQLVVATLAPVAPLVFTMIPLDELLRRVLKAVM